MLAGNYPSADDLVRTIDTAYEQSRRELDDPLAAAHVYRARAFRALVSGNTAAALSMFNVAITNFEQAGDMRAACRHLVSSAAACIELGGYDDARRALDDAASAAARMGLTGVTASIWHHQGMLLSRLGDVPTAIARADAAIDAFVGQGDRQMEAAARTYRAMILAQGDDLARAEREARMALETSVISPPRRALALAVLARVLLQAGRTDEALVPAREAVLLVETLGGVEEGESYVRLTLAEALESSADHEGAAEAVAAARVRILERAALINEPFWKERFLDHVHENARTALLAREWRVV
jgi:tetratricopeptide (TPR) repeat protein